jgi:hypothetical protein
LMVLRFMEMSPFSNESVVEIHSDSIRGRGE